MPCSSWNTGDTTDTRRRSGGIAGLFYASTSSPPGSVTTRSTRPERTRGSAGLTVAAIAAAALLALLVVDGTRWVELRVTDSVLLVRGSHVASDCIQQGIWSNCRMPAGGSAGAVGAWPILQYL